MSHGDGVKGSFYEKSGFSANEAQRLRIMYHVD